MSAAGTVLSQPTRQTSASKSCACVISSIESAITSREISDARMPGVPWDWLSETAIVLNSIGTPPAAVTPSATRCASSRWLRLHGIVPVHVEAIPTIGPPSRDGSIPIARKCARAGARSAPEASASRARRRRASCTGRVYVGTVVRRGLGRGGAARSRARGGVHVAALRADEAAARAAVAGGGDPLGARDLHGELEA